MSMTPEIANKIIDGMRVNLKQVVLPALKDLPYPMAQAVSMYSLLKTLSGYASPEFQHHIQKTNDEISEQLEGKQVTFFENRYLCKDGTYKWMAWQGTPADEHGIVTALGSDINDRKKAEIENYDLQEQYRSIVENISDYIFKLVILRHQFIEHQLFLLIKIQQVRHILSRQTGSKKGTRDLPFLNRNEHRRYRNGLRHSCDPDDDRISAHGQHAVGHFNGHRQANRFK